MLKYKWRFFYFFQSCRDKLNFLGGPTPINSVDIQRTYLNLGGPLDLSANVTGYPAPKFKWIFISTNYTLTKTIPNSFVEMFATINITTYSFRLKKTSIAEDEFGLYTLQLSNSYGMIIFYFYVIREGKINRQNSDLDIACLLFLNNIKWHFIYLCNPHMCLKLFKLYKMKDIFSFYTYIVGQKSLRNLKWSQSPNSVFVIFFVVSISNFYICNNRF